MRKTRKRFTNKIWMACYGDRRPEVRVSTNFTLQEVMHSDIALRLGIDNTPPDHVIERAELVAHHILEPVRAWAGRGYIPNSWYRCEEVEKVLCWDGGFRRWAAKRAKPWLSLANFKAYANYTGQIDADGVLEGWAEYFAAKQHPTGAAVDFEIPGVSNDDLYFWIKDNLPYYDQLIREFPKLQVPSSGWVHCSYVMNTNRNHAFSIPWYDKYA